MKRQQRFIEFYDVRHASRALTQMNGKEIDGKQIVIEFAKSALKTFRSPPRFSKPNPRSFPSPPPPPPPTPPTPPPPPPSFPLKIHSSGGDGGSGGGKSNTEKQVKCRKVSSSSKMYLKGRQGGKGCLDPRFLINEEGVSEMDCTDSRTTVMIRNIPNKYRLRFSHFSLSWLLSCLYFRFCSLSLSLLICLFVC